MNSIWTTMRRLTGRRISSYRRGASLFGGLVLALSMLLTPMAWAASLDAVNFASLPGERVQVRLTLSGPAAEPLSFAIDNPARIALDLQGVSMNLAQKSQSIGAGMARSVTAVEAGGRTRVVLNLIKLVPYQISSQGNEVIITLESGGGAAGAAFSAAAPSGTATPSDVAMAINNIDFRRGENGEGRIIISLSDPSMVVDTREEGEEILVDFINASLPERLERKLDVVDFATPISTIDTFTEGNGVRMVIKPSGVYDHLAYQSDNLFTIEVKPVSEAEAEEQRKEKEGYTGERLSLNFQNIDVRAVLQLIADFTGFNLVASDTVGGNVTLRLKNVPWDQALDIILKSKGLAMRQNGNVIMVAPSEEIAAREKLELEAQKQIKDLAPLRTEFMQVNYAKANDIALLLKTEGNSLMSERGNVSIDQRTNTLLVQDTADNLAAIRKLIIRLDIPVRQVLIESRIVIADDTFAKDLGVQFGISRTNQRDVIGGRGDAGGFYTIGGKLAGDTTFTDVTGTAAPTSFNEGGVDNYIVDLPIGGPSASIGFAIGRLGRSLLQLELQAMQAEGRGEVVSNPRVITSNQREALIQQGTQIPYQEASSSGATTTSFADAVLSLKVTPHITPDDRIMMDLEVSKDSVGQTFGGVPSINTRAVDTQVLVDNGETVVLGGIYEQTTRDDKEQVPFFGDLPYVGFLFKSTNKRDDRTELLIFVTPKILKEGLALQ